LNQYHDVAHPEIRGFFKEKKYEEEDEQDGVEMDYYSIKKEEDVWWKIKQEQNDM
jgi:hypothetical protein